MVALSREAGPFVLSEPELRAGLAEAEASGRLACALCGAPLEAAQATFVRRPLAHRWATLPVHPECARAVGAPPAPAPAPVPAPARPSPPRPAGWPAARLGRLAARRPLAALALTYPDAGAAAAALADLGVRDVPPAGDFDPECGPMVRAVHGLFPDLPVLPLPGLEVSIRPAGHATAEVAIVLPGARLRVRAAAEGLAAFEASAAAGCLILLEAAAAGDGPAEPVAALLRAPG